MNWAWLTIRNVLLIPLMSSLGSYVVYYVHQMHHSLVYDDINLLTYFWTDAIYVAWTGLCFIQQIDN